MTIDAIDTYRLTLLRDELNLLSTVDAEITSIKSTLNDMLQNQIYFEMAIKQIRNKLLALCATEKNARYLEADYVILFKLLMSLTHFWPLNDWGFREGETHTDVARALPLCAHHFDVRVPNSKRILLSSGHIVHRDHMKEFWQDRAHKNLDILSMQPMNEREVNYTLFTLDPNHSNYESAKLTSKINSMAIAMKDSYERKNDIFLLLTFVITCVAAIAIAILFNPLFIPGILLLGGPSLGGLFTSVGLITEDSEINKKIYASENKAKEAHIASVQNEAKQINEFINNLDKYPNASPQALLMNRTQALASFLPSKNAVPERSAKEQPRSLEEKPTAVRRKSLFDNKLSLVNSSVINQNTEGQRQDAPLPF